MKDNEGVSPSRLIVPPSGRVTAHCFRLLPGEQLMAALKQTASVVLSRLSSSTKAAFVITCALSAQTRAVTSIFVLADAEGNAIGGHLIEAEIFTTCEIVLGTADSVEFRRTMDDVTGYNELEVSQMATKREFWNIAGRVALVCGLAMLMSTKLKPAR
ncbi:hypothetical protein THAOC_32796, partial [Thalassiosira oceanica]